MTDETQPRVIQLSDIAQVVDPDYKPERLRDLGERDIYAELTGLQQIIGRRDLDSDTLRVLYRRAVRLFYELECRASEAQS